MWYLYKEIGGENMVERLTQNNLYIQSQIPYTCHINSAWWDPTISKVRDYCWENISTNQSTYLLM